jgi:hypothetical protein
LKEISAHDLPYRLFYKKPAEETPMPAATNRRYRIAVIAGDGIGKEVMPEGVRALEAAAKTRFPAGM